MDWARFSESIQTIVGEITNVKPLHLGSPAELGAVQQGLPSVYVIKVLGDDAVKAAALERFKTYRDQRHNSATYKISQYRPNNKPNEVFYVGKSEKSVRGRLGEHFGPLADFKPVAGTTGALRLFDWAKDYKISVEVYIFPIECLPFLDSIETAMQNHLKPAVGWAIK